MRLLPSIATPLATLFVALSSPAAPAPAVPDTTQAASATADGARPTSPRDSRTRSAPPVIEYRSAFESYRKFEVDAPKEDWITVNTRVQQRGGWREYAREAARANAAPAGDRK
jgi:hypothetical protein